MSNFWAIFWTFLPIVLLLGIPLLGLAVGYWIDRDHRASLDYRRAQVGHVLITDVRDYPGRLTGTADENRTELIVGEVVLACNAFVAAIGRLKMLFGGEVRSFHSLLTRARQEAVLRVMEEAAERGYDAVCNLRLEAVDISGQTMSPGGGKNKPSIYVGLIAYGMAYKRAPGVYPPAAPPTLLDYPH